MTEREYIYLLNEKKTRIYMIFQLLYDHLLSLEEGEEEEEEKGKGKGKIPNKMCSFICSDLFLNWNKNHISPINLFI